MRQKDAPIKAPNLRSVLICALLVTPGLTGEQLQAAPVFNPSNGHYYETVQNDLLWPNANDEANSSTFMGLRGHLATITSQEEQEFIVNHVVGASRFTRWWLGAYQSASAVAPDEGWTWITGEPFLFSDWFRFPAEPNDGGDHLETDEEDFLELLIPEAPGDPHWNDIFNDWTNTYIVEYGPAPRHDGDFDGNGIVDGADFLIWQRGESPLPLSNGDLSIWEANFGVLPAPSAIDDAIPVPEPSTLCILLIAVGMSICRPVNRRWMSSKQSCIVCNAVVVSLSLAVAPAALAGDWVLVDDPGNAPDDTGFGEIEYVYRIGKFEVTNADYSQFLNATSASDPGGLYNSSMRISRTGSLGSFSYVAQDGRENEPVTYVSFWNAARYANWVHHGMPTAAQGAETTEDGAYTITQAGILENSVARNMGARVFLPSENEWYKAAWYKGGGPDAGYWEYPTGSDQPPVPEAPPGGLNSANYDRPLPDWFTDVGAYSLTTSPYGAYDQAGNAFEWTEAIVDEFPTQGAPPLARIVRGGSFNLTAMILRASVRNEYLKPIAAIDYFDVGFRLAALMSADFDADRQVDRDDLTIWELGFAQFSDNAKPHDGDANEDGIVDGADFLIWQREVTGGVPLAVPGEYVPEPSTLWLLAVATGCCRFLRRRLDGPATRPRGNGSSDLSSSPRMRPLALIKRLILLTAILSQASRPAFAIVTSDQSGSHVVAPGQRTFGVNTDGVVMIGALRGADDPVSFCTGALITDRHVLSAAHCFDQDGDRQIDSLLRLFEHEMVFELAEGRVAVEFEIDSIKWPDAWLTSRGDLAVVTLVADAPVDAPRYPLYGRNDEVGQSFVMVGYGDPGYGATGAVEGGDPRPTKRSGINRYEGVLDYYADVEFLAADFDSGLPVNNAFADGPDGSDLGFGPDETISAIGDSGGPTFINGAIAGMMAFGGRTDAADVNGILDSSWGEAAFDTRVSYFRDFILAATGGQARFVPEPATGLLAAASCTGIWLLLGGRTRRTGGDFT